MKTIYAIIGARVEASAADLRQYRWIHSNHRYKSGGALEAHFVLGKRDRVEVAIALLDGRGSAFSGVSCDAFLDVDLGRRLAEKVRSQE